MKLATIGSSAIADSMFESIADIEGIEPAAVYSRTMEKAEAYAKKHNVAKAYDSLETMFADPEIDTVYIASPNNLHYPQAKQALEAGKNVILEKPFTSTLEQAEDLFETAEKNGVMIFEAITNIHTPNFGLLKDNLEMAGPIRHATFNFSQYSSKYDRYKQGIVTNAFDPAMDGGALVDINIYNLHLAVGLFGEPETIRYYGNIGFNGIDTSGTAVLEYPDFDVVCIGAKDSSSDYLFLIQGEEGTFEISKASSGVMKQVDFVPAHVPSKEVEDIRISIEQGLHMSYEFMDFLTAIAEQDWDMYKQYKDETLQVMNLLVQAKAQRDEKSANRMKRR